MSVDIVIAAAPFLSVARPSLGASALVAALKHEGISAEVDYLNLRYAEIVGLDFCEMVADRCPAHLLIGEWIFSTSINPDPDPATEEQYRTRIKDHLGPDLFARVCKAREKAPRFVEDMAQHLLEKNAVVIGFTTTFQQNCASLALAREIKTRAPETIVIFGGANCDGPMGAGLIESYPWIDFVFSGEADKALPLFMKELHSGKLNRLNRVRRGIPVSDMDALPVPVYDDYFDRLAAMPYQARVSPGVLFECARGCWWGAKSHCKFCGLNGEGMGFRSKSADRVLGEIAEISKRHGVTKFAAADNIMNMRHIAGVFDNLAQLKPGYDFFFEVKSNLKTEHLDRIAKGGVTWIQPGIESLNDGILTQMGKGVTGLQNIRLLRSCAELGLHPAWNLLCGFPQETADAYSDMAGLMPLLEHLPPPSGHSPIRLDRFSPYFEKAGELGFDNVRPAFAYGAVYGLEDPALRQIAYFFEGDARDIPPTGYLDSFIAAIQTWRGLHGHGLSLPDLKLIELDGVALIKDTRRCSVQTIQIVTPQELQVLDAFREPARVDVVLARDTMRDLGADLSALIERRLIYRDRKNYAVSLVCKTTDLVHPPDRANAFPGGCILPEEAVQ